jgi:UDP-N-acetylglucosamine--N-acetylmuramyl-(pentapeptide) pyrophosphoryl-undecaprenol N-acetylglucosamine transferase
VTGIPVREAFFSLPSRDVQAPPQLLVFGGSQGARVLNRVMPEILPSLLARVPGLTVLHQAGARAAEETQAAFAASGADAARWQVRAFLDDMPARFGAASLVLARSGASTVAELCAAGKPSLLVPFPLAADDHQRRNAEVLAARGAAVLLPESELTGESLLHALTELLGSPERLRAMGELSRELARRDARAVIAEMVRGLAAT